MITKFMLRGLPEGGFWEQTQLLIFNYIPSSSKNPSPKKYAIWDQALAWTRCPGRSRSG